MTSKPGLKVVKDQHEADIDDQGKRLAPGGKGPHDPDMEARLSAVERGLKGVEGKIDGFDARLRGVEVEIAKIGGKLDVLVGKIPSWWQPTVSASSLLALLMAAIAAAKYFKILE